MRTYFIVRELRKREKHWRDHDDAMEWDTLDMAKDCLAAAKLDCKENRANGYKFKIFKVTEKVTKLNKKG